MCFISIQEKYGRSLKFEEAEHKRRKIWIVFNI
jgi:hypothetical protein